MREHWYVPFAFGVLLFFSRYARWVWFRSDDRPNDDDDET